MADKKDDISIAIELLEKNGYSVKQILELNLYQKLQKSRVEIQNKKIKKTGKGYNFEYFELNDILPPINEVCYKNGLTTEFHYSNEIAKLLVIDSDKPEKYIEFSTPVEVATLQKTSAMQNIGATQSYCRRYLYMMAFEIAETDLIDGGEVDLEKEQQKQDEKQGKQYIDKAAATVIKTLLTQTNADEKSFLEWVHADKVEHIRNRDLGLVMKKLKEKQAEKAKKENELPPELQL